MQSNNGGYNISIVGNSVTGMTFVHKLDLSRQLVMIDPGLDTGMCYDKLMERLKLAERIKNRINKKIGLI
jgi:hypothetical protein